MKLASRIFRVAGIYGIVALVPMLFLEEKIGRDYPPAITHPEHFYGFVLVALAFQLVFLVIARDPVRYRALMPVAMIEKFPFALAVFALYAQERVAPAVVVPAVVDFVLGVLFAVAWARTAPARLGAAAPASA